MTDMVPEWATAVPNLSTLHTEPAKVGGGNQPPLPWNQLVATVQFFLTSFIGQIAVALGGIDIFGWKPLEFLAQWGQDRIDEASAAYIAATTAQASADTAQSTGDNAQSSADNANVGVARLEAQAASGSVVGGVVINDTFARSASGLGTDWDQVYAGSGVGTLGTDGNNAHWTTNGSDPRTSLNRYKTTALATDYQGSALVHTQAFDNVSTPAVLQLNLRCNSANTHRVVATIRINSVEIGYVVSGTYTRIGTAVSATVSPGDGWKFNAGTTTDVREFVLYQNGNEICRRTDSGGTSQYGSTYRYTGFTVQSGQGFAFFFFDDGAPDVQFFTAYDRLASAA